MSGIGTLLPLDVADRMAIKGSEPPFAARRTNYRNADKVAIRGKTTMVHRGEFQGIPPTGKHLELRWLDIMRIEDGKNAEEWLSMDLMGFIQQLEA